MILQLSTCGSQKLSIVCTTIRQHCRPLSSGFVCSARGGGALSIDSVQGHSTTFVSISNSTFALNSAQLDAANNSDVATGSSTFVSLQGLGGAMRLFVAALWLDSTVIHDNFAPAAGGAIFFDQSCLPVCPNSLEVCCDDMHCMWSCPLVPASLETY